ncbi:hypothetical protein BS329_31045 [Amycolatopsis coloradensis]|uniref:Glucose-methanol-choline oxidoreductase C-terminal domain-containing protein n=1 Tax=Amycolatopsis coloradensis TaxID=76021 RepID=A0A1R0KJ98_9PSEU|nr:hypothetical protein BS329_31045 [Amycolatopsis coloradensis]
MVRLLTSKVNPARISRARCASSSRPDAESFDIHGDTFIVAASPVESARLVLNSELDFVKSNQSAIGHYLAEHIYCRGYLDVSKSPELNLGPINIFIPPLSAALKDRFQIEIRSIRRPADRSQILRLTGSAAMDPNWDNRVEIAPGRVDRHGTPMASTILKASSPDEERTKTMLDVLHEVASSLGGKWSSRPLLLPRGASYHEAGTLRIALSENESAADADSRLLGASNLFVGDGAAFPSIGVANPILTLTAMGYRLADRLVELARA